MLAIWSVAPIVEPEPPPALLVGVVDNAGALGLDEHAVVLGLLLIGDESDCCLVFPVQITDE
jgi:hypothetical protein